MINGNKNLPNHHAFWDITGKNHIGYWRHQ